MKNGLSMISVGIEMKVVLKLIEKLHPEMLESLKKVKETPSNF